MLRDFVVKGYVLDSERLKNGKLFNKQYFEALLEEIREIRASERQFYQKVTDLFATASDYDSHSGTAQRFFASSSKQASLRRAPSYGCGTHFGTGQC